MKTKELKNVPGLNPDDVVVIKQMDYGEKSDLGEESSEITFENNKEKVNLSISKLKIYTLVFGVVSGATITKEHTKEQKYNFVRKLEPKTGDFLFQEITDFNKSEVSEELKKK